jgi:hypothetical protein
MDVMEAKNNRSVPHFIPSILFILSNYLEGGRERFSSAAGSRRGG